MKSLGPALSWTISSNSFQFVPQNRLEDIFFALLMRFSRRTQGHVERDVVFEPKGGGYFMAYFFFKLVPPRPSFPQDMTEAEGELMKRHAAYWQSLLDQGFVLVFGPVLDPKGPLMVRALPPLGMTRRHDPLRRTIP